MNFCESCNIACKDERCPKCGRKKLRAVNAEDFCLIARVDRLFGDSLKNNLEEEAIAALILNLPCRWKVICFTCDIKIQITCGKC